jgi:hypothetical protein
MIGKYDAATGPGAKGALLRGEGLYDSHISYWPQSFRVLEVRLLIVLVPGFGCGVCLAVGAGRPVVPGVPGCAPAPTAPGWSSFRAAGAVCAGQAGADRAQSRCQQMRNASFQGQSGLILRMRWRA